MKMAYRCSPDTQYCISSEMELLYNTCEMGFVARIMDADLDEIHDNVDGSILANLSRRYSIWYDQIATPIEKSLIGYYFIHYSHYQLRDFTQAISHALVDSYAYNKKTPLPYGTAKSKLINYSGNMDRIISKRNVLEVIRADPKKEFFISLFYGKLALYSENITHTFEEAIKYYYEKYEKVSAREIMRGDFQNDIFEVQKKKKDAKK